MSHFIKLRTQIREKALLEQALRDRQYTFQSAEGNVLTVNGYQGNREHAEVVVSTGSAYDIGFQKQQEHYDIVADWWGVHKDTHLQQESFCQEINRQYAYNVIRDQAEEQDLVWEDEQVLANGDRVIVLSERG